MMNVPYKHIIHLNKNAVLQTFYLSCAINVKNFCHSNTKTDENKNIDDETSKVKPFSGSEDHTWVGPPHPVSNLRLKVFPTSNNLTKEETHFYERSKEVQNWNQEYWESHNKDFEQSKRSYIERKTKGKESDSGASLNTEEMADFYREFLNKNYDKHLLYNWQWYKKNFELLYLSAKAKVSKFKKVIK